MRKRAKKKSEPRSSKECLQPIDSGTHEAEEWCAGLVTQYSDDCGNCAGNDTTWGRKFANETVAATASITCYEHVQTSKKWRAGRVVVWGGMPPIPFLFFVPTKPYPYLPKRGINVLLVCAEFIVGRRVYVFVFRGRLFLCRCVPICLSHSWANNANRKYGRMNDGAGQYYCDCRNVSRFWALFAELWAMFGLFSFCVFCLTSFHNILRLLSKVQLCIREHWKTYLNWRIEQVFISLSKSLYLQFHTSFINI